MMKWIFSIVLVFSIIGINAQSEWPAPPKKDYPDVGDKKHVIDYLYLDIANWDKYTAGNKTETNEEIPALITYYTADNELVFSTNVGIRLSGIFIRKLPQKSIAVEFSKKRYGSASVNYDMWSTREYDELDGFVIRAHGNPLGKTYFKDGYMNQSLDEYTDLEYSAFRPVIMYVNGDYQGLFNIREKKNKDFVKNLYGISKKEMSLFDVNGGVNGKPDKDWEDMITFVNLVSLQSQENYKKISDWIDIDNFIDYNIAHIYFCNTDWPKANVKVWKHEGGKWRWMFFDCDRCHSSGSVNFNTLEHITGLDQWAVRRKDDKFDARLEKSSILIRKLMENEEFRTKFIIRYQDLLNTSFTEERLTGLIEESRLMILPEIQQHIDRWLEVDKANAYQHMANKANWEKNIEQMRYFVQNKPEWEYKFMDTKWNLGGTAPLAFSVSDVEAGYLKINTVIVNQEYFRGEYFNNMPVTITAVPNQSYEFVAWEGSNKKDTTITVYPKDLQRGLKAVFKKVK